ncbi:hypothetical protein J26TS2_07740 [Shouchella clausii]|uniref:hypothetical protein n=1 Tax=Shouchella tritolerans TaxID=2979466 RepID=UPI001B16EA8D|nr:hypothetical protein [Shouchella tritolerans]GIN10907.1 hypothetical protein J26TS2_07740 [Shouchella clausii]
MMTVSCLVFQFYVADINHIRAVYNILPIYFDFAGFLVSISLLATARRSGINKPSFGIYTFTFERSGQFDILPNDVYNFH